MMIPAIFASAAILIGPLGGCETTQTADEGPKPPRLNDYDTFETAEGEGGDRVRLGGMPSERALDQFAAEGGRVVLNLRRDSEMEFLPFYESAVNRRGMRYIHIPTSGDNLGDEQVRALERAMAMSDGPVLVHCAGGGRAKFTWAMHRVKSGELNAEQAIDTLRRDDGSVWESGAEAIRKIETEKYD